MSNITEKQLVYETKVFQMQLSLLILSVVTNMLLCYVMLDRPSVIGFRYQGQSANIVCSHCCLQPFVLSSDVSSQLQTTFIFH